MNSLWITFWEVVLIAGLSAFLLLVLAVIPLGARDIKRMFSTLDARQSPDTETKTTDEPE
ncbi:MAG: hypothetical protein GXP26_11455 [Planctomycetes bacterium]|nr:hypothetical protein [Planctomycetota bacterium]